MGGLYVEISAAFWLVWVISWKAASFWRAETTVEAPRNRYRLHFAIVVLGFLLTFGVVPWMFEGLWTVGPVLGWINTRILLGLIFYA